MCSVASTASGRRTSDALFRNPLRILVPPSPYLQAFLLTLFCFPEGISMTGRLGQRRAAWRYKARRHLPSRTSEQTTANQRRELQVVAKRHTDNRANEVHSCAAARSGRHCVSALATRQQALQERFGCDRLPVRARSMTQAIKLANFRHRRVDRRKHRVGLGWE